jgi:hypothetical protein
MTESVRSAPDLPPAAELFEFERFDVREAVRPHHATDLLFQLAFIDTVPPKVTATMLMEQLNAGAVMATEAEWRTGYHQDSVAPTPEGREEQIEAYADMYRRLRALPDDSSIILDIGEINNMKDPICAACPKNGGKHCTATNYKGNRPSAIDTIALERLNVDWMIHELERYDYEAGSDYAVVLTQHELTDYGGKMLSDDVEDNIQTVTFEALIVRIGVLRDMAQQWFNHEVPLMMAVRLAKDGVIVPTPR